MTKSLTFIPVTGFLRIRSLRIPLTLALALMLLSVFCTRSAVAAEEGRKVLILHSYHQEYIWTESIHKALVQTMYTAYPKIDLYVEYLNTKRQSSATMFPIVAENFRRIYSKVRFDIILATDNQALDFMLRYRDELFPKVPVVFCGINNMSTYHLDPATNYTGVSEDLDAVSTIAVALRLNPGTKRLALITDVTETGQINMKVVRKAAEQFPDLSIIELNKMTEPKLKEALGKLQDDTVAIMLSFFRDPDGRTYTARESMDFVVAASPRPVYSLWDFYLVPGAIGGKLLSARLQGEAAAKLAIRVLHGETAGSIPIVDSVTAYMFDYTGLRKFKIDEARLPAGSIVIGKPDTFYTHYKYYLWFGAALLLVQAMIISLLTWNIARRRREEKARLKAEEALSYSVSLTNAALESTPDGILIVDSGGKIARWNRKFVDLWQVPRELLGQDFDHEPLLRYVTDQMARPEEFLARLRELYSHPEESSVDSLYAADGRIVERYSQPQRIGDVIVGRFWSFRDITERKQMESALAENENRLRTVMQTIPDLVWLKDADGLFLSCNSRFESLYGAREADIVGKTDYDFVDRAQADFLRSHDRRAMEAKKPCVNEEWVEFIEDGRCALLETVRTPMYDAAGRFIGVLSVGREITERKELEQERLKIEKLESLGVFAGGIAHDFNNILTGIMGNITFAMVFLDPADKPYVRLAEAEKASKRAAELAQQLLTFARGGKPIKKVVSIEHILHESISLLLRGSNVKGIIEPLGLLDSVEVDEGQINQVFNNIIINAIQAMPDGGTLRVAVNNENLPAENSFALPGGKYVRISFTDEGCGIAPNDLKKIFDPYFTTKLDGNGLGLASTYSIINSHGGNISAASTVGQGATFTIYLPATNRAGTSVQPSTAKNVANTHRDGSILVMDDEEMIRDLATNILEHLGYQVKTCSEGAEAVELYKAAMQAEKPFTAVLIDLTIAGGMGGKEAAQRILSFDPGARLIVSSGYSNDPIMSDFTAFGFTAAVAKPYAMEEFDHLLGSLHLE